MRKQILIALFFSLTYLGLNAQCNLPFPPALTCSAAPVICGSDLDGYCTATGAFNATDSPNTFCSVINNNQWFAFVAGTVNINLDIIVTTCTGAPSNPGLTGLQAQVYSVCGAPWTTASNCLIQIFPNTTQTLVMTNLTVGNIYYLMTDGVAGDVCDYSIQVTSGSTTAPIPDPAGVISGDPVFCPGASSVTYCVPTSSGAAFYEWTIPVGTVIVGADNEECITIDFSGYTGGTGSSGIITVTPTNACEFGDPSSLTVTQGSTPTTPDVDFILCPGDTEVYGSTTYSTGGTFLNTDITNAQGCLVETFVNVTVGQDVTTDLVEVICQGGTSSTGETTEGFYTYPLLTSLGCDSTVTLDLTVLDPQTGIFPVTDEIDCSGTPITVSAIQINTDPTISYIWTGPCFTQSSPQDPNISVSCGGTYTVYAEQTVAGVTCGSSSFSVTVIENITPPIADPGQLIAIDCNTNSATLGGPNMSSGSNFVYSWTGPNGYTSSQQNPVVTEGGEYCVFVINSTTFCQSTIECVTVTGNSTSLIATASNSNDLSCLISSSILDASGSSSGGNISYTWDGPGGPYSGSNPSVSQQGTYTLTVMDNVTGCTSTAQTIVGGDFNTPTASIITPADIDCNNPTVSLDGSGSSSGVTYLWSTGETTSIATTNMGAGTYTLTVTNISNGCTDEASVLVNDNSSIVTADVDVQGVLDCDNNLVTLSAINVIGSSNPTYSWSNGMSGQTIMVGTAGSITLTVTDAITGCSVDVMANVASGTNAPTALAGVSGELNCNNTSVVLSSAGSSTGVNITASWSNADPNNVTTPGTYTLTITDNDNGCTATADVDVIQDITAPVAAIVTPIAIDCNNTSIVLDGGTSTGANLSYSWTPGGGAGSTLNAVVAGTYTLTVTNMDNGCTDTEEVIVVDNTTSVSVTASVSNELTCTQTTATLDVSGGSGSSNPTYTWTGPETGNGSTISVSTPGIYTLTLVDANTGCQGSTTITVLQDDSGPTASVAPANNLTCNVSSVTLDGSASSSGNNISYQWFIGGTTPVGGNTSIIDVSVAGDYTLLVTDNDNGCDVTSSVITVILDNSTPTASAVAGNNGLLSCSISSLALDGSSSTGNCLSYEWSSNGIVVGTNAIYDASNAGDYILVVTNCDNGCTDQTTINVMADSGLPSAAIGSVVNLDCNNSSSTLQGSASSNTGGTVSVEWFFEGTTLNVTDQDYIATVAGVYTFVVTDNGNGCSSSATVQLSEDIDSPFIDITTAPIIDCANNMVTVNAANSASGNNITYQWQDAGGVNLSGNETANTLMTGTAGDYILVVTNTDNGCTSTQSVTVLENIEAPVFNASALNNIDCNNMEAQLTSSITSSFSSDLSYEWIFNASVLGTMPTFSTANDGSVTIVVTDNQNGCSSQMDVTVLNTIQDPTIAVNASSNGNLDCIIIGTTLNGIGSDTGANFIYTWTLDTAPMDVLSTDLMYSTMDPGTYILTITNTDNGCVSTETITVTQSIETPMAIATSNTATLTCSNPTITLDGTSSSIGANFTYQWYEMIGGIPTAIAGANTISYDIIFEGTYELIVTNTDNGCTTISAQIVIDESADAPIAVITSDGILTCDNETVTVDGLSSTAGGILTYQWVNVATGDILGTDPTLEVLTSIEVELNIQDLTNGCTSTSSLVIDQNINAPTAVVNFTGMLTCDMIEIPVDGSASTSAGGAAIEYAWSNGSNSSTTNFDAPGTYTLVITDVVNSCTATQEFTIDQDILPPVADIQALTSSTISCTEPILEFSGSASNNNGNPNGGTLTYEWTLNGNVVSTAIPDQVEISEPGDLVLEVTNTNNGCVSTFLLPVDVNDDVPICNIPIPPQPLSCIVDEVTIVASGSTGIEYTYQWTTTNGTIVSGGTTLSPVVSEIGIYTLTVTNTISGCDVSISAVVSGDFDEPIAVANVTAQFDCVTDEITLDATGSTTGSTIIYSWTTTTGVIESGSNTVNPVVSTPGEYTLEITDTGNGCIGTAIVNVSSNIDVPTVEGFQVIDPNCFGESNGSIILDNVTGGEVPYLYSIDGSALGSNNQFSFLPAGQYDILVEDASGCTVSQVITITDPQKLSVELGDNQIIGLGDDFQLSAQIVGAYDTIMWSANCPDSVCANQSQFSISPLNTVSYNVTVVDGNGCITSDQITITVEKGREVYIPNAFSPNDDGYNDRFWVYPGKEVAKIHEFRVFNRWGEEVFGISDYDPFVQDNTNGWDGFLDNKKMNPAVFVYYVDVEYIDGKREVLKGDVTLRP